MQELFFDKVILGNTLSDYVYFLSLLLFAFIARHLLSEVLSVLVYKLLQKRISDISKADFKRLFIQPLELLILLVFSYLAFSSLNYPPEFDITASKTYKLRRFVSGLYDTAMIGAVTWVVVRIIDFFSLFFKKRSEKTISKMDDQLVPFFTDFAKVIIYIAAFVAIMSIVFKVNVATLLGGLGVGGLALAFAAKESLENLLASFMIFLDQPFVVGDLVHVGEITGHVEKIGFRSTRIRTLERSFVTVPNKLMIDKPLDNLTLRTFRRAKFDINLTYDATSEQIRKITEQVQHVIDHHPRTNNEGKVAFHELGPHSKNILVLYFIDTMDYYEYLSIREEINFQIVNIVKQCGCQFAFPTRTLHVVPAEPGQEQHSANPA